MSKKRIANVVYRYPRLAMPIVRLYRLTQRKYTVGVIGVLFDDAKRVLLVEHVFHPFYPWGMPGGWVGRMEDPSAALVREFMEETGLAVRVLQPLIVQKGELWGNHLDVAFLVEAKRPLGQEEITLSYELVNYGWFARDEIPRLSPYQHRTLDTAIKVHSNGVQ